MCCVFSFFFFFFSSRRRHTRSLCDWSSDVCSSDLGDSVWENVVTSCAPCNLKKGNRLLEEASMVLQRPPRPPQPVLFIRLAAPKIPHGWRQYLPDLEGSTV